MMKAAPYGSYSNIEYEDITGNADGDRVMTPQRYNQFPTVAPNLRSADINSYRDSERSSLFRLSNSHPLNEIGNTSQGTSPVPDWIRKNGEIEGHMRNTRWNGEGSGYAELNYQGGPSNYLHGSCNNRFGESLSHCSEYDVPKTFEYLERDRAELLRKLSELEDQLVRSGSKGEQGKQRHRVERSKYHHESFGSPRDWLHDSSSVSSSASKLAGKHVTSFSPYPEKYPYTEMHNVHMRDSYHHAGSSYNFIRHGDHFESHIPSRGTKFPPTLYQEHSYYPKHLPLQSTDADDPRISGSPHYCNTHLHQPDCSCFHCYNNKVNCLSPVQSRSSTNTKHTNISSNPKFYHQKGAQLGYNSKISNSSPVSDGRMPHVRWPSELGSSVDELARGYPQSTVPVKVNRRFRPIYGGAPFVTCSNCFELLQLRRRIIKTGSSQQQIQCGACSSFTYFAIEGKGFVFSTHGETMDESKEMKCGSDVEEAMRRLKDLDIISNEAVEEMLHTRGPSRTSKSFQSDELCCSVPDEEKGDLEQGDPVSNIEVEETNVDLDESDHVSTEVVEETLSIHCQKNEDNKSIQCDDLHRSGDDSPLMDKLSVFKVPISPLTSHKSLDAHSLLSAVNSDDDNPEECVTGKEEADNADDASDDLNLSPLSTNSARQGHHGYSPTKHAVYWFGTHSQIQRAKLEDIVPETSTPSTYLVKEFSAKSEIEAETEVPHSETPKANIVPDTTSCSKTEDPPSIKKEGFFAEKCDVTINDHPIPDHLVKKAEDLAGPVLPGNYWYDFRAGFWGVIGGPCLGIIPPKIKQFDYPISQNCSGGTTGVIVNGRELHNKDLALLYSRGLPIERGKSYIVEISGRIVDKDSGEELDSLGQLAPTIERLKHGFGMKVSKW